MPPIQHFLYTAIAQGLEPDGDKLYSVLEITNSGYLAGSTGITLSNNDLSAEENGGSYTGVHSTISLDSSSKYYWEILSDSISESGDNYVGMWDLTSASNNATRYHPSAQGDTVMCAYDGTTGKFYLGLNGVWVNDPTSGVATHTMTPANDIRAWWGSDNANSGLNKVTFNFGESAFTYSVPSGYNEGVYEIASVSFVEWENLEYDTTYGSAEGWQFTTNAIDIDAEGATSFVHEVEFVSAQTGKGLNVGFGSSPSTNIRYSTEEGRIILNGSIIATSPPTINEGDIIRAILYGDRIEWWQVEPNDDETLLYTYTFGTDYANGSYKALVVVSGSSTITFQLKGSYYAS